MNIREGANGYLQIVNDQQEINKARSSVESLNFENEKISSLIKEISKESINLKCYIRTINLPGLGLGQRMGLEHKVLEVYLETEEPAAAQAAEAPQQQSIKKLEFLFSVGGKQILDLEYIENKLTLFTDINDSNYYLEFPDQFLQYDVIKKDNHHKFIGEYDKGEILFIDNFEGAKLVDYLSYLRLTGKHNYLEDYIGMTIARDLYKVDEGAGKIKKSSLELKGIQIDRENLIKLLFVLLVNKNNFKINGVIGNYDEVESDPKIQEKKDALRELEGRGVYCLSEAEPGDYYSEYDNKLFFTNIFTNDGELSRLDSMFNKYYKEIINAVGILFKNNSSNNADICIPVYQLLRFFFEREKDKIKIILLENRMIPYFFYDMYDFNGAPKGDQKLSILTSNLNEETNKSLEKLKKEAREQLSDKERKTLENQEAKQAKQAAKQAKQAAKQAAKEAKAEKRRAKQRANAPKERPIIIRAESFA